MRFIFRRDFDELGPDGPSPPTDMRARFRMPLMRKLSQSRNALDKASATALELASQGIQRRRSRHLCSLYIARGGLPEKVARRTGQGLFGRPQAKMSSNQVQNTRSMLVSRRCDA